MGALNSERYVEVRKFVHGVVNGKDEGPRVREEKEGRRKKTRERNIGGME